MRGTARFATVLAGAAAVGLMGVLLGAWWAPFAAGIAAGALLPRARWALLAGAAAGLAAWGIPLVAAQVQYGLGPTATSLAASMGFTGAATIPVALTLLEGLLLGLTGSWFGAVARSLYPRQGGSNRNRSSELGVKKGGALPGTGRRGGDVPQDHALSPPSPPRSGG